MRQKGIEDGVLAVGGQERAALGIDGQTQHVHELRAFVQEVRQCFFRPRDVV